MAVTVGRIMVVAFRVRKVVESVDGFGGGGGEDGGGSLVGGVFAAVNAGGGIDEVFDKGGDEEGSACGGLVGTIVVDRMVLVLVDVVGDGFGGIIGDVGGFVCAGGGGDAVVVVCGLFCIVVGSVVGDVFVNVVFGRGVGGGIVLLDVAMIVFELLPPMTPTPPLALPLSPLPPPLLCSVLPLLPAAPITFPVPLRPFVVPPLLPATFKAWVVIRIAVVLPDEVEEDVVIVVAKFTPLPSPPPPPPCTLSPPVALKLIAFSALLLLRFTNSNFRSGVMASSRPAPGAAAEGDIAGDGRRGERKE